MSTWPDGTPRSQGNAFDLGARTGSVFYDPKRKTKPPAPKKKPARASVVAVVDGLSERARDQLKDAPYAITIGTRAETEKRRAARKASI